jgi:hypothetical protein
MFNFHIKVCELPSVYEMSSLYLSFFVVPHITRYFVIYFIVSFIWNVISQIAAVETYFVIQFQAVLFQRIFTF